MARLELLYSRNLWNINNNDMDKDTNLLKQHYSNNAIFFQDAFPNDLKEYALTVLDTHYPVSGFIGDGTKGGVRIVDPNMRQSEVRFIHLKEETKPIFDSTFYKKIFINPSKELLLKKINITLLQT